MAFSPETRKICSSLEVNNKKRILLQFGVKEKYVVEVCEITTSLKKLKFMSTNLIQSLVLASGGLASIGSILLVVILLGTERGIQKAIAYLVGYGGAYLVLGVLMLVVGGQVAMNSGGGGRPWITIMLNFLVGGLMLFFLRKRLKSPVDAGPPKFFRNLHTMSARKALGFGVIIAVVNFKNLAIYLSSVAALLEARLPLVQGFLFLLLILVVFFGGAIAPIVMYLVFTESVDEMLRRLREWLERHNRIASIVLLLGFGSFFVGKALYHLLK